MIYLVWYIQCSESKNIASTYWNDFGTNNSVRPPASVYSYRFQFRDQRSADKVPCLHWWIPRLGLKLEETGKIPSKTKKVIIIFWGILCRGNIVITWSRCASNLPSLDLWLFPVSCSFLGKRLNQDQLQWGPSWKCRRGAYMLDTLGP